MRITGTLKRFNDHSLPENFVSMAVLIDKESCEPSHAAILIRHEKIDYLLHFPGATPPIITKEFNENECYVYNIIKPLSQDDPSEVGSILQHCKRICKQSDITYSFIFDGSSYDENGKFSSAVGLPEFGTCVGFCLNALSNILIDTHESIIELDDWDDSGISNGYNNWSMMQAKSKYPNLDWTLYNAFKKRITPTEYICIPYLNKFPIRKSDIDQYESSVLKEIKTICCST